MTLCTFWIPANTPKKQYAMTGFSKTAWPNSTFIVEPTTAAPAGSASHQWLLLDDVDFRKTNRNMPGTECFDPGSVVLDASGFLPNWSPEPTPAPAPVPRPEAVDSAAWYGGYGWYGGFEERPDAGPLFFGRSAEQDREQSDASEYLGRPGLRAGEHETSVGRSGPGGGEAVASRDMRADPLTVLLGGTAAGTVTSTPAGITCAGGTVSCTGWFAEGDTVALTATPDTGMVFVGWAGACTGTDQPCEVTMNGAKSVVAHFASPLEFYHLDVLGSVRMVTNAAGAVVKRHDYFAFGEDIMGPEGDPRRFTAKERDAETELHYFGARYYRSVWGRFTSVDPVMDTKEAVIDPQLWNRYTYVANRPTLYIDPDGKNPFLLWLHRLGQTPAAQRLLNSPLVRTITDPAVKVLQRVNVRMIELEARLFQGPTTTVWDSIRATAGTYAGTDIPRTFELTTKLGKVWVNSNATEHLAEFAKHLLSRGYSAEQAGLSMQLQLGSLQGAVQTALSQGIVYGKTYFINGWQLTFGAPSSPGQLPVLYHALFGGG
jgi:RHS repeat-associated protein